MGLNNCVIQGRFTRDPERRETASGTAVTSFTLAVDRDFAPEGQERKTDFIDCVAWSKTADFVAKYFSKGKMAVATGRLEINEWTDKDNNKRKRYEIIADRVYFSGSKSESEGGNFRDENHSAAPAYTEPSSDFEQIDIDDSDLPF